MGSNSEVLMLLDFYNLPPVHRGKQMNFKDHEYKVNYLTEKIVKYFNTKKIQGKYVKIRFYGGWYTESMEATDDNELLSAIIRRNFPTTISKNRYNAEIADHPLNSDFRLYGTLRIDDGLPPIFIKENKPQCICTPSGVDHIISWRKSRCPIKPDCEYNDKNFFYVKNQKIVDTLVVADALYYIMTTENNCIVVSHDDDLLPCLLYSTARTRVTLLRPDREKPSLYEHMRDEGYQIENI